jgi:chromosome segregation ATPase
VHQDALRAAQDQLLSELRAALQHAELENRGLSQTVQELEQHLAFAQSEYDARVQGLSRTENQLNSELLSLRQELDEAASQLVEERAQARDARAQLTAVLQDRSSARSAPAELASSEQDLEAPSVAALLRENRLLLERLEGAQSKLKQARAARAGGSLGVYCWRS